MSRLHATDVSEPVSRSPAESREIGDQLRIYAEHSPAAIAMFDREMRYLVVSRRWMEEYHLGEESVVGRSHYDVFPDLPTRWKEVHQRCLAGAVERNEEDPFVQKDGTTAWIRWEVQPWHRSDGSIGGIIVFSEDITNLRATEQALLARNAFFEAKFEATPDGTLVVDDRGTILTMNRKFVAMFNIPESIAAGGDDALLRRHVIAQTKSPVEFSERIAHLYQHPDEIGRDEIDLADGRRLDRYSAPVRDHTGKFYGRIWTFRDITESSKLEAQLLRTQRLEAIGTLSSGIAHDLNNILAPMLMATGLISCRPGDTRSAEMLAMIESGAQRGANIIRQLLTFSRGIEGQRVTVQPRHLILEMAEMARATFPRNITVKDNVPRDLHPVSADATQLHQVLMNLCVNSRDAMPVGGLLTLRAQNVELHADRLPSHPDAHPGRHVLVTISDTGTGIPAEVIDRIFDPFFTTKPIGKGTGLGLSTTLGIVKSHGGFITVESTPGAGATFGIYLPAEPETGGAKAPAVPAAPRVGNDELVLVVDDEVAIRQVTSAILRTRNYRVLLAASGEEALAPRREHANEIELAIVDLMMPGMGGLEFIRRLRVVSPGIRVVAVTGMEPGDDRAVLAAMGVADILLKPYVPHQLLEVVAQALDANR